MQPDACAKKRKNVPSVGMKVLLLCKQGKIYLSFRSEFFSRVYYVQVHYEREFLADQNKFSHVNTKAQLIEGKFELFPEINSSAWKSMAGILLLKLSPG